MHEYVLSESIDCFLFYFHGDDELFSAMARLILLNYCSVEYGNLRELIFLTSIRGKRFCYPWDRR